MGARGRDSILLHIGEVMSFLYPKPDPDQHKDKTILALTLFYAVVILITFLASAGCSIGEAGKADAYRAEADTVVLMAFTADPEEQSGGSPKPKPEPSPGGKCVDCDGTGRSGDGIGRCGTCGGTGKGEAPAAHGELGDTSKTAGELLELYASILKLVEELREAKAEPATAEPEPAAIRSVTIHSDKQQGQLWAVQWFYDHRDAFASAGIPLHAQAADSGAWIEVDYGGHVVRHNSPKSFEEITR